MEDKSFVSQAGQPTLSALDLARAIEAGTMTPGAVVDRCAQAIAYHKAPGYVAFVDQLPLSSTQKLQRGEVPALRVYPDSAKLDAGAKIDAAG